MGHYECAGEKSFLLGFSSPNDVRMQQGVRSGSDALFMGIAPGAAIDGYLDRVAPEEPTEWNCSIDDITSVEYTRHEDNPTPDALIAQRLWVTSVSSTGQLTLDWMIESGEWAIVIMNADGSSGVSSDSRFGALAPSSLHRLAWTSFVVGLVALIRGGRLPYVGCENRSTRRLDREQQRPIPWAARSVLKEAPSLRRCGVAWRHDRCEGPKGRRPSDYERPAADAAAN